MTQTADCLPALPRRGEVARRAGAGGVNLRAPRFVSSPRRGEVARRAGEGGDHLACRRHGSVRGPLIFSSPWGEVARRAGEGRRHRQHRARHSTRRRPFQPRKQRQKLFPFRRLNDVIGIKPKRIITGRMRKCLVPRRREAIDPLEIEHLRPKLAGDLLGSIRASRIDDDDLVEDPFDRGQAPRKVFLLVFHDHRQRDRRGALSLNRERLLPITPTRSASEGSRIRTPTRASVWPESHETPAKIGTPSPSV